MINTDSIKKYLDKEISDSDLAVEYYPYIKTVAATTARKLIYDPDDLAQELWDLFVSKVVFSYDFSQSLEGYVYEFARRHCLYLKGMNREIAFSQFSSGDRDSESDEEDEGGFWLQNENGINVELDEESIHSRVKGQRLAAKTLLDINVLRKLPCISDELESVDGSLKDMVKILIDSGLSKELDATFMLEVAQELHKLRLAPPIEKDLKEKVDIPADHRELREIRMKMGKTKPQFAKCIGIHITSLDAYEYGKTKKVPQSVMETARMLASNFTDELFDAKQMFSNLAMSEIVAHWANKANIDVDDFDRLAVLLETTRTTIRRWLSNESRAEIAKIAALDKVVMNIAKTAVPPVLTVENA